MNDLTEVLTAPYDVPRLRTLDKAYDELLKLDPGTSLSKNALRKMMISGEIPTVRCGRFRLVNFNILSTYLNGTVPKDLDEQNAPTGIIRPVY